MTSTKSPLQLLTLDQVAEALACNRRTVQREIERKRLRAVKVGSLIRVPVDVVERYVRDQITATA